VILVSWLGTFEESEESPETIKVIDRYPFVFEIVTKIVLEIVPPIGV
jgi:hypothetical protein